ncbi:MAG TPA: hypothetical protein VF503_05335 [Sphingobium sp.]|uniref:hypothetical protein n=1 Tax=Sphingobium sp. TaxID=1912891 RepID=UPI002ED07E94
MKISRNNSNFGGQRGRRRNPLVLPVIILIVILALLLGWFWSRGGEKPQQRVEKSIPAERLGH